MKQIFQNRRKKILAGVNCLFFDILTELVHI